MAAFVVTGSFLVLAACGNGPAPKSVERTSTTTTTTTTAPTTTTTVPTFPAVVVQAMAQFVPLPAGARAPIRLPAVNGYLTAQTGGLGGQDNVTLVVTDQPVPVDSPALQSSHSTELASFATTPTASTAGAQAQVAQQKSQTIAACGGASTQVGLADGTMATSCPTLDGTALTWQHSGWTVQVIDFGGQAVPTASANQTESTLVSAGLPASDEGGFVSVQVPANAGAGSSTTAAIQWSVGADDYQVRSSDNPTAAIEVASAMRPYPSG